MTSDLANLRISVAEVIGLFSLIGQVIFLFLLIHKS